MTPSVPQRSPFSAVRAIVRIQTPAEYDPVTGDIMQGRFLGFDSDDIQSWFARDIVSISLSKSLDDPCGRANIEFVPRRDVEGCTYADRIPSYSVIEIYLQRWPENPQPVLVFIGLTDARNESESYHEDGQVERKISISARELSCIFVDWRTLYLPAPPVGAMVESTTDLPGLYSQEVQLLGMLALDPELALIGESPVSVVGKFVQMMTTGLKSPWNPDALPLVNLSLPYDETLGRARTLADYIVFDEARAKQGLFDPTARLPAASQMTLTDHSLWHLVETFSDPVYQELFTQSVELRTPGPVDPGAGTPPQGGVVEVVFRKKPFGARLDAKGELDMSSLRLGIGESQFDKEFEQDPINNLHLTDRDVTSISLRRSPEDLYNLYYVFPQIPALNYEDFRSLIAPLVDDADGSPSSVSRYGVRLLHHADYYFDEFDPQDKAKEANMAKRAQSRAKMLYYWYRHNPLFYRGEYQIRGNPHARVGMRMVHTGRELGPNGKAGQREYYIKEVAHTIRFGEQVSFRTRLGVQRGWPITAGAVA